MWTTTAELLTFGHLGLWLAHAHQHFLTRFQLLFGYGLVASKFGNFNRIVKCKFEWITYAQARTDGQNDSEQNNADTFLHLC